MNQKRILYFSRALFLACFIFFISGVSARAQTAQSPSLQSTPVPSPSLQQTQPLQPSLQNGSPVTPSLQSTPTPSSTSGSTLFPNPAGAGNSTICQFLTSLLNIVTEIGAILGVLFLIWSGFRFVYAQGSEDKLKDAKRAFWYTILGITLLLSASVVARLVVVTVSNVISGSTSSSNAQNTPGASEFICSS